MTRSGLLVSILACAMTASCAGQTTRIAKDAEPVSVETLQRLPVSKQTLKSGLRVVTMPRRGPGFEIAIFMAGGPLLDPPQRPGLTEWTLRSAFLGTLDDGGVAPAEEALALGVSIVPVMQGNLFGWIAFGPPDAAEAASTLLYRLVTQPSFPATSMQVLGARERRRIEASGDEPLETVIAVATGYALGLKRPLRLEPSTGLFDSVVREDVARHWKRWFRPEHAVLVTAQSTPSLHHWSAWENPSEVPTLPTWCTTHGSSVHLIRDDEPRDEELLAIRAGAIPGLGTRARRDLGAWFRYLGERPSGPIATRIGEEQARRASPSILDLAVAPGESVSVTIIGARGGPKDTLDDLGIVGELLRGPESQPVDAEALNGALRAQAAERHLRLEQPITRSVLYAEDALFGHPTSDGVDGHAETAAALLDPWRFTLVGLGGDDVVSSLEEGEAPFAWDSSGEVLKQGALPRCEPRRRRPMSKN